MQEILEFVSYTPTMITSVIRFFTPVFALLIVALLVEWYRLPLTYSKVPEVDDQQLEEVELKDVDKLPYRDLDSVEDRRKAAFGRRMMVHVGVVLTLLLVYILIFLIMQPYVRRGELDPNNANIVSISVVVLFVVMVLLYFAWIIHHAEEFRRTERDVRKAKKLLKASNLPHRTKFGIDEEVIQRGHGSLTKLPDPKGGRDKDFFD